MNYILIVWIMTNASDGRMVAYSVFPGLDQCRDALEARQCDARAKSPPNLMGCYPGTFPDGFDFTAWLKARSAMQTP